MMKYEIVTLKEKTVVGLTARTNNMAPDMGEIIGGLWEKFFEDMIYPKIPSKKDQKSLGIYTEYAGGELEDYTILVGCEVTSIEKLPENTFVKRIPSGTYAKFIVIGDVQKAVQEFWMQLGQMNLPRSFVCDFEEYQNSDMEHAEIHIYIGLKEESSWIESRCGIRCSDCEYKEKMNCKGCVFIEKPFWGESCQVKQCCETKSHMHCGECSEFPCSLLQQFAYDKEQGDDGKRIEQCKQWNKKQS